MSNYYDECTQRMQETVNVLVSELKESAWVHTQIFYTALK